MGLTKGQAAATALQARLNTIQNTFSTGTMMVGAGIALAAPLMMAANKAEQLEFALNRVQTATGATNLEMAKFNTHLSKVSNMTGVFSKPKLAEFAYHMYESGIMSMKDIDANIEQYAKGADVLNVLSKGRMSFENSAHAFSAIAHHYGYYKKEQMGPVIDAAVALSKATPGGISTFQKMGANIDVLGNRILKMDPRELMALEAAISQTTGSGGAGRGGLSANNVINALKRSMPGVLGSGMLTGASGYSAAVLGLADKRGFSTLMKGGKMNIDALMARMFEITQGADSAHGRVELARRMLAESGRLGKKQAADQGQFAENIIKSGGRDVSSAQILTKLLQYQAGSASTVLSLFGDPKFLERYRQLKSMAYNSAGATDKMQEQLSQSTHFQRMRAATNVDTLMSSFGMAMLPTMKKVLVFIADAASRLNDFVEKHPRVIAGITGIVGALAGLLIVGGLANMLKAAWMGVMLFMGPLWKLVPIVAECTVYFVQVGLAVARLYPPLTIAITAITALVLVITNWGKITEFAHKNSAVFIAAGAMAIKMMEGLGRGVLSMVAMFGKAVSMMGSMIARMPMVGDLGLKFQQAGNALMRANAESGKKDLRTNEQVLETYGMKGLVNAIKGNAQAIAQSAKVAAAPVNATVNNHFHGPVDGKGVQEATKQALKDAMKDIGHAASAVARGGGVPKSRYAYGAGK